MIPSQKVDSHASFNSVAETATFAGQQEINYFDSRGALASQREVSDEDSESPYSPDDLSQTGQSQSGSLDPQQQSFQSKKNSIWSEAQSKDQNEPLSFQNNNNRLWVNLKKSRQTSPSVYRFVELNAQVEATVKMQALNQVHMAGRKIQSICIQVGRCPLCTLQLPCKHSEDFMRSQLFPKMITDYSQEKIQYGSGTIDDLPSFSFGINNTMLHNSSISVINQKQDEQDETSEESNLLEKDSIESGQLFNFRTLQAASPRQTQKNILNSSVSLALDSIDEETSSYRNSRYRNEKPTRHPPAKLNSSYIDKSQRNIYPTQSDRQLMHLSQSPMQSTPRSINTSNDQSINNLRPTRISKQPRDNQQEIEIVSQRLRTIEMTLSYRQKKIQNEMFQLQEDLRFQEQQDLAERRRMSLKKERLKLELALKQDLLTKKNEQTKSKEQQEKVLPKISLRDRQFAFRCQQQPRETIKTWQPQLSPVLSPQKHNQVVSQVRFSLPGTSPIPSQTAINQPVKAHISASVRVNSSPTVDNNPEKLYRIKPVDPLLTSLFGKKRSKRLKKGSRKPNKSKGIQQESNQLKSSQELSQYKSQTSSLVKEECVV